MAALKALSASARKTLCVSPFRRGGYTASNRLRDGLGPAAPSTSTHSWEMAMPISQSSSQRTVPYTQTFRLIYLEKINFQNVLALKLYLEKYFFLFNSYYRLVHKTAVFGHHKGVMRLSSLDTMRLAPQARHYMSCLAKHGGVT